MRRIMTSRPAGVEVRVFHPPKNVKIRNIKIIESNYLLKFFRKNFQNTIQPKHSDVKTLYFLLLWKTSKFWLKTVILNFCTNPNINVIFHKQTKFGIHLLKTQNLIKFKNLHFLVIL